MLVPKGSNRALCFERAQDLADGQCVPLTLTYPRAGKAIVDRRDHGPGSQAAVGEVADHRPVNATLKDGIIVVAGSHRLLFKVKNKDYTAEGATILMVEDQDHKTHRPGAGHSFVINDNGTISPAKVLQLVLGEGYQYDATMRGKARAIRLDLAHAQSMAKRRFRRQLSDVEGGSRDIHHVNASCYYSPE